MAWGDKWVKEWPKMPVLTSEGKPLPDLEEAALISEEAWNKLKPLVGIDLGKGDSQTILTTFEDGEIKHRVIPPEELYNNAKPTHDPYANPDAHIYYMCNCGAILDPQTKSFAQLNNCASEKGWKIRFTDKGYVPYCVKCGEGVE